jgi:hypothetical protein
LLSLPSESSVFLSVTCGCETVCQIKEGTYIEGAEKEELRKIFGLKREKSIGGWRKLLKEGFIICTVH